MIRQLASHFSQTDMPGAAGSGLDSVTHMGGQKHYSALSSGATGYRTRAPRGGCQYLEAGKRYGCGEAHESDMRSYRCNSRSVGR